MRTAPKVEWDHPGERGFSDEHVFQVNTGGWAGGSYVAGLWMPFCCQKKKKCFLCHPAKLRLHTCFPETETKMWGGGRGRGRDWSDSYISRMRGHPHHLGISWRWLQPPVNPGQGSFEIQGKPHGQEQAGLAQREEKRLQGERSGF